jgi:hypothetical protein
MSEMEPPLPFSATVHKKLGGVQVGGGGGGHWRPLTDTTLGGPRLGNQLDKLQAGGLSNLVVDTGHLLHGAGVGNVNAQISDLAVEVGCVDIVLLVKTVDPGPAARVLVGGQDAQPDKVAGGLDGWPAVGIADHLGAEGQGQHRRNQVFAWRKIHDGVLRRKTVTGLATTLAVIERLLDGLGVVSCSVSFRAILFDVSEDLCGSSASARFPQRQVLLVLWGVMSQRQSHFFLSGAGFGVRPVDRAGTERDCG